MCHPALSTRAASGTPCVLLTSTTWRASSCVLTIPAEPGTVGTPAAAMVFRAVDLSPMVSIWSGSGPMNSMPCALTISTNVEFSDCRNVLLGINQMGERCQLSTLSAFVGGLTRKP